MALGRLFVKLCTLMGLCFFCQGTPPVPTMNITVEPNTTSVTTMESTVPTETTSVTTVESTVPTTVIIATTTVTITTPDTELSQKLCVRTSGRSPGWEWFYYNGYCYSVYTEHIVSYNDAKYLCRVNGAHLASVHSSSEMNFIYSLVPTNSNSFWIGLRWKTFDESLSWEDGTPVDYLKWTSDYIIGPGLCTSFKAPSGSWDTHSCTNQYNIVCKYESRELPITTLPSSAFLGNCPDGWYTFEDKCYKFFGDSTRQREKWDVANQKCEEINSDLVSIHSNEEQSFLNRGITRFHSRIWIGLRRTSSRSEFHWEDKSQLDYSNWNDGEPNNHLDGEENCVQLLESFSVLGKWNDAPCNLKFPYVCQMSRSPMITKPGIDPSHCTQPEDWLKIKNSCFKIFQDSGSPLPWLEAQSQCERNNGTLATVKSDEVTQVLQTNLENLDGYFWIGINSLASQRYSWIGGGPLIYSNWEMNQPKDVSEENNCVALNTEGDWMVRDCNESLPFICEVSEEGPETFTLPPHHPNMTCPDSSTKWHDFGGKYCYIVEVKKRLRWYEALCRCKKEGGSLASFHSLDEVNVVIQHLQPFDLPMHIGFQRDIRGNFVWSDGSPSDFSNWDRRQPSSSKEQCSAMDTKTGKWSDIQCFETHSYICSTSKVPEDTKQPSSESQTLTDFHHMSAGMISLTTLSVLAVLAIGVALYYVYPSMKTKLPDQIAFFKTN